MTLRRPAPPAQVPLRPTVYPQRNGGLKLMFGPALLPGATPAPVPLLDPRSIHEPASGRLTAFEAAHWVAFGVPATGNLYVEEAGQRLCRAEPILSPDGRPLNDAMRGAENDHARFLRLYLVGRRLEPWLTRAAQELMDAAAEGTVKVFGRPTSDTEHLTGPKDIEPATFAGEVILATTANALFDHPMVGAKKRSGTFSWEAGDQFPLFHDLRFLGAGVRHLANSEPVKAWRAEYRPGSEDRLGMDSDEALEAAIVAMHGRGEPIQFRAIARAFLHTEPAKGVNESEKTRIDRLRKRAKGREAFIRKVAGAIGAVVHEGED